MKISPTGKAMTLMGAALGSVLGLAGYDILHLAHAMRWWSPVPIELSDAERGASEIRTPVPVMDVVIHFRADDDFPPHPTGGKTAIGSNPCEISLRASDYTIFAMPFAGEAEFVSAPAVDQGNIAHELLHCIRGYWHPGWNTIIAGDEHPVMMTLPSTREREDGQ